MKNFNKILASAIILVFLMSFAGLVYAASGSDVGNCSNDNDYSSSDIKNIWPLVQCGNSGQHCCDFKEATILVNRIINWFIGLAGIIATITFAYAGAQMLLNPSNPGKRQEAIEMLKKTVFGILIVLGAWLIVHTIVGALAKPSALYFLGGK